MLIKMLIFLTIAISMFSENVVVSIDWKSNWNDIKNKTKNILAEGWNKSRGISQVGPKPSSYLDYPGLNGEKLKKNIKIWNLYYKCLEELLKNINKNNIFQAKEISAFKSSSLSLECELCISPKDLNHKNVWYYSWQGNPKNLSLVNENNYFRISSLDLSLTIINMDESKSGYYQCKLSNSEAGPYFIELIKDENPITLINNSRTNYTSTNIVLKGLYIKMWYRWTQWSSCSKCDEIGKKTKFGHCFVSLNESTINTANMRHNLTKNHSDQEIDSLHRLFYAFDTGLPCQSNLIDVSNIFDNILQNTATQIMIEYCEVKCNNNDIFEIKDIKGNVKERVNNSAGVYSPLQIMPELPPQVETIVITTFLNQQLNITCPGNLNSDAPYEWRINNHIISSTSGKIAFDILNRLIIQNITEDDEKIYTCWQNDYLAGIVEIMLIKDLKIAIQEYLHLYGVYFVLGIFIWVGFKMFIDREAANFL